MKILLILSDGTRPDSLEGIEFIEKLKRESTYCMAAQTVMPSVTLPCHMSLFHSVDPSRHGTTTNTYAPQVRPISGLFEQLKALKRSARCSTTGSSCAISPVRAICPTASMCRCSITAMKRRTRSSARTR